jgi:hypothetical protein
MKPNPMHAGKDRFGGGGRPADVFNRSKADEELSYDAAVLV